MRLTSDFWTAALIRQIRSNGAFAYLIRRGALEAGAIFIEIRHNDGSLDFYGPAPQSLYAGDAVSDDRLFVCLLQRVPESEIIKRLEKELHFDPDIWLIEVEGLMAQNLPFKAVSLS